MSAGEGKPVRSPPWPPQRPSCSVPCPSLCNSHRFPVIERPGKAPTRRPPCPIMTMAAPVRSTPDDVDSSFFSIFLSESQKRNAQAFRCTHDQSIKNFESTAPWPGGHTPEGGRVSAGRPPRPGWKTSPQPSSEHEGAILAGLTKLSPW